MSNIARSSDRQIAGREPGPVVPHPFVWLVLYFPLGLANGFPAVALGYLANSGLAAYHAGVEWHFWPGPDTCTAAQALPTNPADLLKGLDTARVVRCDEATWRLFGLSFAGWNVLISLALFAISLQAALAARARG